MLRGTIEKATGTGEQNALAPLSHEKKPIRPTPRPSNRMSGASSYLRLMPCLLACPPTHIAWTPRPSLSPSAQSIARPPPARSLACSLRRYRMRKRPASRVEETGREDEPTNDERNERQDGKRDGDETRRRATSKTKRRTRRQGTTDETTAETGRRIRRETGTTADGMLGRQTRREPG